MQIQLIHGIYNCYCLLMLTKRHSAPNASGFETCSVSISRCYLHHQGEQSQHLMFVFLYMNSVQEFMVDLNMVQFKNQVHHHLLILLKSVSMCPYLKIVNTSTHELIEAINRGTYSKHANSLIHDYQFYNFIISCGS